MTTEEKYQKLIAAITEAANGEYPEACENAYDDSGGNFDDAYQMGVGYGEEAGKIDFAAKLLSLVKE
jgi:hypothetical protein